MPTTYNDPIMLDSTGQDIVDKLDSIASLMGDGVIDDTSTTATDKTWSANKENTVVNGLQDNIIANTKLIKDTVGWSGKNKAKNYNISRTIDTVAFTKNTDESITLNTSAETTQIVEYTYDNLDINKCIKVSDLPASVKISGSNSNDYGIEVIYRTVNNEYISNETAYNGSKILTIPSNAYYIRFGVIVKSGVTINNKTVYPMLYDASILDSAYEPYFGSTAFPRSEQAVLGAKNQIPFPYLFQTSTLAPPADITCTVDSDGVITLDGTHTGGTAFIYLYAEDMGSRKINWQNMNYTLNGCPAGGGSEFPDGYHLDIISLNHSSTFNNLFDNGSGTTFNGNALIGLNDVQIRIRIADGTTLNNLKFKPMISFDGGQFVPPAMSNEQLSKYKANDMCSAGNHTLYMIATAVTPSSGLPELFIPWTNPNRKSITFGNDFEVYMRVNSVWSKLTWTGEPNMVVAENGFYISLPLDTALTPEQVFAFMVQGKIIFS